MLQTQTAGDFRYVMTRFSGLKTTIIYHRETLFEIRKEYMCLKCLETKEVTVYKSGVTTQRQIEFFENCAHEALCPCCYTGTDKAVAGAAENLMALLN